MSKIGVGVGEDFPVDDGHGGAGGGEQGQPRDDHADYEDWKRRRAEWRAQREQWRAQQDQWRAAKRAFKEKVRQAARESFGRDGWDYRDRDDFRRMRHGHRGFPFGLLWLMIPILAIVLFFSLVSAAFKAPFAMLALLLGGAFFFSWSHRHRRYRYYSDRDIDMPQRPPPRGPIVTPPPSPQQPPPPPTTIAGA